MLRVGGTLRLLTLGRLAMIARFDLSLSGMADRLSNCVAAPNGTCREYFPSTAGPSIGVGGILQTIPRVQIGGSMGVLRSTTNPYAAANASFQLAKHFDVLAELRYVTLRFGTGERVWFRPLGIGVRVY